MKSARYFSQLFFIANRRKCIKGIGEVGVYSALKPMNIFNNFVRILVQVCMVQTVKLLFKLHKIGMRWVAAQRTDSGEKSKNGGTKATRTHVRHCFG